MLFSLYKTALQASTPLLEFWMQRRLQAGKEDAARGPERRGIAALPRGEQPLVWFHAASVGESLSLLPLIEKMLKSAQPLRVLVTTGTVTSAKLMGDRLPKGAFHQYAPVDHPAWVERFLGHWRPDLALWAESEFWPNMLLSLQRRKIPAILLNARMSEKSFRRWQWFSSPARQLLQTFSLCLAQNGAEAARLQALGARNVRVSANLKYASAPLPADSKKLDDLQKATARRTPLLWASTHPGEEEIALATHEKLKKDFPALLTIIVPRHPARGGEAAALAEKHGMKGSLRSQGALPSSEDNIYIADTLGELGLFFSLTKIAVIGGSFVPVGGHNPIEPAQLGCTIVYGPHMFNFISICDDFESRGAALRVANAEELPEKITALLQNPPDAQKMSAAAKTWVTGKACVADDIFSEITPYMPVTDAPQRRVS